MIRKGCNKQKEGYTRSINAQSASTGKSCCRNRPWQNWEVQPIHAIRTSGSYCAWPGAKGEGSNKHYITYQTEDQDSFDCCRDGGCKSSGPRDRSLGAHRHLFSGISNSPPFAFVPFFRPVFAIAHQKQRLWFRDKSLAPSMSSAHSSPYIQIKPVV